MAAKTCRAEILVALPFLVLVIHAGLVVFMAEDALKCRKARGVDMTIRAIVPLLAMLARVDREVLCVMIPVGRRPRSSGVTCLTGRRETSRQMVRCRCVIVTRMTGEAL